MITASEGILKSVKIDSFYNKDAFRILEGEWNDLLKRSVTDTPFSSLEWHRAWWNAYHPGDLWILSFRNPENLLIGIASLFIVEEDGKRIVHFVGCEDVTDYLDILVDKEHQDLVYQAFVEFLCSSLDKFDALDLCNIPAKSPTIQLLPDLLSSKGFANNQRRQEVCPVIPLPARFEDYLASLDKKQRKELERKLRIAEGQGDSISWYIVNEHHDLAEETEKFMRLMASSHPEKAKFLEDEQHVAFFKELVPAAMKAGWLQLNFLEVAGDVVAAYLNFDYKNQILVYNSGLDPNKAAALSPGIILLAYNIKYAIEEGREVFDFLRGDEQYKYRMGGQDTEIFNLKAGMLS